MEDILGKYKFVRKLGKGTYGEVILVEDEDGSQLALKMIAKQSLQAISSANLEGEIKCMTQMNSKYIMKILGVEEDENYKYLVCEYCNGGDLLSMQARLPQRVFRVEDAVLILADVILGLEELHKRGYLHRDIKSQNIIIQKDKNNIYKLADFGFAKKLDLNGGTVLGSEPFMSPEVFSSQKYGFEVDMWAFGVIFYFMLNMEYPFRLNPHMLLEKRVEELKKLASTFDYAQYVERSKKKQVNNCTPEMKDLFRKMFHPDPNKRITFAEIREHSVFKKHFPEGADKSKVIYANKLKQFSSNIAKGPSIIFCSTPVTKKKGSKERLYVQAEHDKLMFLVDTQKQLNFCEPLSVSLRESLNYNLTKYFIILFRQLISRLNKDSLMKEQSDLDWNNFCQKIEFKKMVLRYQNQLKEAELKLQTFYDSCIQSLEFISQKNPLFEQCLQRQVTENQFQSPFKQCYRKSTNQAYSTLLKYSKEHPQNRSLYLTVIITMCHCYNFLLESTKQELGEVFADYAAERGQKIGDYIDFEDLRGWLMIADSKKLSKIIKSMLEAYF